MTSKDIASLDGRSSKIAYWWAEEFSSKKISVSPKSLIVLLAYYNYIIYNTSIMKVLLVEDDPGIAELLREGLSR